MGNEMKNGKTAIEMARELGHLEIVELLLKSGANPTHKNDNGKTAIDLAKENGFDDLANTMEKYQKIPTQNQSSTIDDGDTPLFFAVKNGNHNMIPTLIKAGAHVNQEDKNGASPLHYAAKNGCTDSIRVLYAHGANIDMQDYSGETPLHFAVMNGRLGAVNILLECGASTTLKNNYGHDAVDTARKYHYLDIVQLFESMHEQKALSDYLDEDNRQTMQ